MYAHTDRDIYVTLYAANRMEVPLAGGAVGIQQETEYPFDGKIVLTISPAGEGQRFNLRLRIPTYHFPVTLKPNELRTVPLYVPIPKSQLPVAARLGVWMRVVATSRNTARDEREMPLR